MVLGMSRHSLAETVEITNDQTAELAELSVAETD